MQGSGNVLLLPFHIVPDIENVGAGGSEKTRRFECGRGIDPLNRKSFFSSGFHTFGENSSDGVNSDTGQSQHAFCDVMRRTDD